MTQAPLPSGSVTFCFTDVEGSTRLFRRLGNAFEELLLAHRSILREAFGSLDGVEVSAEGDGLFYAFGSAERAIEACVLGQRRLSEYRWPDGVDLRVRMGVHTGEARPTGHDYFALSVHQASRVMAAAHGGQIVLSADAAAAASTLPALVRVTELGPYRLKDFDDPVTLFQVCHPELTGDFPPPRAPSALATNLPRMRTSFIGREAVLAEADHLLRSNRIVSLIGPAGVGKTRLAVELAGERAPSFPDGIWFVDLAPVDEPELIGRALAAALGIPEHDATAIELAVQGLRGRCLIVIDNCEHLIDDVASFVDGVIEQTGATVLATSRAPLRVQGERIYRVPPLSVPSLDASADDVRSSESVQLFADRAEAANASLDLDGDDGRAVLTIVRRLDGVPLALELAAARASEMPVASLAAELEHRLDVLGQGPRTSPPRQRTLEAALAWSVDLLSPAERDTFACLSVFPGAFALDDVAAVCGAEASPALPSLVERSLVSMAPGVAARPYRLLESIRAFAAAQLAARAERAEELERRHLRWCLSHVDGGAPVEPLADDVHHAVAWAAKRDEHVPDAVRLALWGSMQMQSRGRFGGSRRLMEQVLDRLHLVPAPLRAEALRWTAVVVLSFQDQERAELLTRRSLALAEELGDRLLQARCMNNLGAAARLAGRMEEARTAFERALALAEQEGSSEVTASALQHLGLIERFSGEPDAAIAFHRRALELALAEGDRPMEALCLARLGGASYAAGRLDDARGFMHAAGEAAAAAGSPTLEIQAAIGLAWIAEADGELEVARKGFAELLDVPAADRLPGYHGDALVGLAQIARRQGDLAGARSYLRAATDHVRLLGRGDGLSLLEQVGYLAAAEGDHAQASRFLGAAARRRRTAGEPLDVPRRDDWDRVVATIGPLVETDEPLELIAHDVRRFLSGERTPATDPGSSARASRGTP